MIEKITYTGTAYPVDTSGQIDYESPTHIAGEFSTVDVDYDDEGWGMHVADKSDNEYYIDGADALPAIDIDAALQ
jgi:hypothetical protein